MPDIVGRLKTPRLPSAPATPTIGEIYYNTADNTLWWWNGTVWVSAKTVIPPRLAVDAQVINNDANLCEDSGWYRTVDGPNDPVAGTQWYLQVIGLGDANYCIQYAHNIFDLSVYKRRQGGGSWTGWIKIQNADGSVPDTALPQRLWVGGSSIPGNDFNNATSNGWYWSQPGDLHAPGGSAYYSVFVIVAANNFSYVTQIATDSGYGAPITQWLRSCIGGVWGAWTQTFPVVAGSGGGVDYIGNWGAGITYKQGDVVRYNGNDYMAVNPSTGVAPPAAGSVVVASGLVSIFDVVVGRGQPGDPSSGATVIDTNTILGGNIPQNYKHLELRMAHRTNIGAGLSNIWMRLNNDAGSNYSYGWLDKATWTESGAQPQALVGYSLGASSVANFWAQGKIEINDYTNAKIKSWHYNAELAQAGPTINYVSGMGVNSVLAAAITRFQLYGGSIGTTQWLDGSRFTLYGVT